MACLHCEAGNVVKNLAGTTIECNMGGLQDSGKDGMFCI